MTPAVSLIIPVGPGHARYLPDALRSVQAQSVTAWEALVINDTGRDAIPEPADERICVLQTAGGLGPAAARNAGVAEASAPWLLFLDADDALWPRALEHLLRGALAYPDAAYLYGGHERLNHDGHRAYSSPAAYDRVRLLQGAIHLITGLYDAAAVRAVGGFDPTWPAHEDWDLAVRLAIAGYCAAPVAAPIFTYRTGAGQQRLSAQGKTEALRAAVASRYGAYLEGRPMAGCCGGNRAIRSVAAAALTDLGGVLGSNPDADAPVRMEAAQGQSGYYKNPFGGSGQQYRVSPGNGRFLSAHPADVAWLQSVGFRVLARAGGGDTPIPGLAPILAASADLAMVPEQRDGVILPPPPMDDEDAAPAPKRRTKKSAEGM